MRVIEDAWRQERLPRAGVGTVGNFDGVHLGQRAVLDQVVQRARELDTAAVVVTFEPHPLALLRPGSAPPRLTTRSQKERQLELCGIDTILVVAFDEEFAATPAHEFVEGFLFGALDLREIYVGSRFAFGRGREGNLELLERLATRHGRRAAGVAEVSLSGEPVSSTRIRSAVILGEVESAAEMLGRNYQITGRVVEGARQGRGLGWPTINLELDNELPPARGVYTSRVEIEGERLPAVTNIGVRPTLHDDSSLTVESHILDFEGDLYGRHAAVEFEQRLRDERRFSSVDELVAQIAADVEEARRLLGVGGDG